MSRKRISNPDKYAASVLGYVKIVLEIRDQDNFVPAPPPPSRLSGGLAREAICPYCKRTARELPQQVASIKRHVKKCRKKPR